MTNSRKKLFMRLRVTTTCLALFLLTVFAGGVAANAETFYVALNGSDSSQQDGSMDRPWASVNYALSRIQDNDTIKIMPGTYNLSDRITITGRTGVTVTAADVNKRPVLVKTSEGLIQIEADAVNTTLSHLVIDNGNRRRSYWYGNIRLYGAGAHIHHCEIRDGWQGIEIRGGHSHEINNNEIHNFGTTDTSPESGSGFGIAHVSVNGSNWDQKTYIHHNKIYDAGGDSYQCQLAAGVHYVEIAYNDMYGNGEDSIDLKWGHHMKIHHNLLHDNAGDGIVTHSNQPSTNIEFYNNRVYKNGWWGMYVAGGCDNWKIYNNLIYDNAFNQKTYNTIGLLASPSSCSIFHNTIVNNGRGGYRGNGTFCNNLVFNNGDVWGNIYPSSSGKIDSNYVYPVSPGTAGSNAITSSDPRLADMGRRDFSLTPDSPCIDSGMNSGITLDYVDNERPAGSGYDLGAFEYALDTPAVPPSSPKNLRVVGN